MAEKEYIEREAALKRNYFSEAKTPDENYRFNAEIKYFISSLPAADVVEVVRCKDCEYYPFCFRTIRTGGNRPDDFCSYGVRKEG